MGRGTNGRLEKRFRKAFGGSKIENQLKKKHKHLAVVRIQLKLNMNL